MTTTDPSPIGIIDPKIRLKKAKIVTAIGLVLNLLLASVKIAVSFIFNNLSLLADGLDSGLDITTTVLSLIAIKISDKPADKEHQFGHSKIESLFSLGIAVLLISSSGIIAYQAIVKIINHLEPTYSIYNIIVASSSIVLKTILLWINVRVGKKIKSPSLIANGMNFRTDILTSMVVLISVSVAHRTIGSFELFWIDPTIALIIAIVIIITAIKITKDSSSILMDESPPKETIEKLKKIVKERPGVKAIKNIRARTIGSQFFLADIDLMLDPKITLEKGHDIVSDVEEAIKKELPVKYLQIHMEPYDENEIEVESK